MDSSARFDSHLVSPVSGRTNRSPDVVLLALVLCFLSGWGAAPSGAIGLRPHDVLALSELAGTSGLYRVDSETGEETLIAGGAFTDFSVNARRELFAIEGGAVVQVDPATGATSHVSSGGLLSDPQSLVADRLGDLYVTSQAGVGAPADLVRLSRDASGWTQSLVNEQPLFQDAPLSIPDEERIRLYDLALLPDGNLVVAATERDFGILATIDIQLGSQSFTPLRDGPLFGPQAGIGIGPGPLVFHADGWLPAILGFDPVTGEVVRELPYLFPDFDENGDLFIVPRDIAFDAEGRAFAAIETAFSELLMGGTATIGIMRFDPDGSFASLGSGRYIEVEVVPVPEPGTALLLGLGLSLIACGPVRRRRCPLNAEEIELLDTCALASSSDIRCRHARRATRGRRRAPARHGPPRPRHPGRRRACGSAARIARR